MKQIIVALLICYAPAPVLKPDKPEPKYLTPGRYWIVWGSCPEKIGELTSSRTGWYWYFDSKYFFIWEYDPSNRIFTMWECNSYWNGEEHANAGRKDQMHKYTFKFLPDTFQTSPDTYNKLSMKRVR